MSLTAEAIGIFWLWLMLAYFWVPPVWLLMRFITPRNLVREYFREPYFNGGELIVMRRFPGSLFRTVILMAACTWPSLGKKRQLETFSENAPKWYVTASRLFLFLAFAHAITFILLLIGLLVYIQFVE